MAINSMELKGIVVGHTARVFSPKKTHITKVSSKVVEAFLGGYVQILVNGKLAFVQCPLNTACVVLHGNRAPTIDEVHETIRSAANAYPVGMELEVLQKEFIRHDGKKGEPFYVVRNKPPVNQSPYKKRKQHQRFERNRPLPAEPTPVVAEEAQEVPS